MSNRRRAATGLTATDFFCGAGGSSSGLRNAGFTIERAANHWDKAIETHSANHPDTEHIIADINNYDMRSLPSTTILWASVICTEASPANGQRKTKGQMTLEEATGSHVPKKGFERTRACAMDVIRATEVHRYAAVVVENVINFVTKWELFDWFVGGMKILGYNVQVISASSAHVWDEGNDPAPQWRNRIYVIFTRVGIPLPDVQLRPLAYCFTCEEQVRGVQSWKKQTGWRAGEYGRQYIYVCPNMKCRNAPVEPYVLPAAAAIDWTDTGDRIGDKPLKKFADGQGGTILSPLAPATMRRIQVGIDTLVQPVIAAAHGNTWERPGSDYVRAWPALESPLMARTGTPGDGIATPTFDGMVTPFIAELRGGGSKNKCRSVGDPLATVTAGGNHHGLTVPPGAFVQKHHGGLNYKHPEHMVKPVGEPFGTIVTQPNMSLVIPFRRGAKPHYAGDRPLSTLATHEAHGVMPTPSVNVEDCHFRMLSWREHANGQRFDRDYKFTGNGGENTMLAGNAVSANVAQWIGKQLAAVL